MLFLQTSFLHIKSKYLHIFHLDARMFPYFLTQDLEVSSKQRHLLSVCETFVAHKVLGSKYFWKSQGNPQDIFNQSRKERTYFMNKYPSDNSFTAGEANLGKKIKEIWNLKRNLLACLRESKDQWGLTQAKSNFTLNKLDHWFRPKSWLFLVKEHDNKLISYIC